MIRALIEKELGDVESKNPVAGESLLQAAKRINAMGRPGPKDLASKVDQYLYGSRK